MNNKNIKTYWGNQGEYQKEYDKLHELIPVSGEVNDKNNNKALEKLRKASNCYYDLYNNGLCNRAVEFRSVFGFVGTFLVQRNDIDYHMPLEQKMDQLILDALAEQKKNGFA